ncbi:MlaD family protein [Streptomyces sp. NPDC048057]|uniref:MlaD family protein n=1 Tax=Streptomyces sp. NPDC048057 TaxID=3155628 RepID=UPI0033E1B7B8
MLTLGTHLKNLAFLVIAVVVLAFVGIRYADLGRYAGIRDHYTVRVELPRTGGLFTHSNVTYRGVSVGRVGPIDLTDDGVEAELRIKKSAPEIPADLEAVVASLSAVGEQYIDLRPRTDRGPHLAEGSVIAQRDTRVPAPVTQVLTSVDALASSVDLTSLRTVVDEFGTALQGRGDDLQVLLDSGDDFVRAADRALPVTIRLIDDGERVLRTQVEQGAALRSFASGTKELAAQLKGSDADLRRLVAAAPEAAGQLTGLLKDLDPSLGVVVANLLTTSEVAVTRQRGIAELLVKMPAVAAAGSTAITAQGVRLGMSVTFFNPLPCTAGYGGTRYRVGTDTAPTDEVNTRARCASPASSGVNVRGSANAPRGGPLPAPAVPGGAPRRGAVGAPPGLGALLGLEVGR